MIKRWEGEDIGERMAGEDDGGEDNVGGGPDVVVFCQVKEHASLGRGGRRKSLILWLSIRVFLNRLS
jgi:hypothetical protein